MNVKQLVIALEKKKDTAGTVVYAEVPDEDGKYAGLFEMPSIKTQYIQKFAAARMGNPKKIRITIEAVDD